MRLVKMLWNISIFLLLAYLYIGGMSLAAVAAGEAVPYLPFWHGPWRAFFEWLGFIP